MGHLAILLGQYYYHFHYREEMWAEELRLPAQDPMACKWEGIIQIYWIPKTLALHSYHGFHRLP